MIAISKLVYETLKDKTGNLSRNPVDWWKKNKLACSWCLLCMMATIPLLLLKCIVMIVCFIPHAIYITLDDIQF